MLPTLTQARSLYAKEFCDELEGDGRWSFLGATINRSSWRISFPGGSYIQLLGAAQAAGKRGFRCDFVGVDEVDDCPEDVFDSVISAWFTEPWSLKIRAVAGTPRKGRHGLLYRTHSRGCRDRDADGNPVPRALDINGRPFARHFSLHATGYDTPGTVDAGYLEEMRLQTPADKFKREYLCDFDAAEGLVYPEFTVGHHVCEPHPDTVWSEHIVGVDWGYEDQAVILVAGLAGRGRDVTIHVLHEEYLKHHTDSMLVDVARRIDLLYPGARWYCDPSRPGSIAAFRSEARLNARKADNAIDDGVATVADTIHVRTRIDGSQWSQLYVSPRAVNTIRELGEYRRKRDPHNPDRVLETVSGKDDHAVDALRYMIHTHFGGPDRRIREGT